MGGAEFQQFWLSLILSTPRIIGITLFIPFLRAPLIPPQIRNSIVFILGLTLLPMIWQQSALLEGKLVIILILKEVLIGMLIGIILSLSFLIPQAVGDFIDNQRGASIAAVFNPAFGTQASPVGVFLAQAFLAWFIISGGFMLFFEFIFTSFTILPIGSFLPENNDHLWIYATQAFNSFMKLTLIIAAPVVLSMLISEIALGLVSRFAPQLNVFFISMSLKSVIAIVILLFYFGALLEHIWSEGLFFDIAASFSRDAAK